MAMRYLILGIQAVIVAVCLTQALLLSTGATAAEGDELIWQIKHDYNAMDRKDYISATATYDIPGGGTVDLTESCNQSTLIIGFASFAGSAGPGLPFEISQGTEGPYIRMRVRYDRDAPLSFAPTLKHYDNQVTINLSGNALSDFVAADTVLYELPLGDGRKAFPEIRPKNAIFESLLTPCLLAAKKEQQQEMDERERVKEKARMDEEALRAQCIEIPECVRRCGRYPPFTNAVADCEAACGKMPYGCPPLGR